MWYTHLGFISIGAQCGGPKDGGLGEIKVDLWKLFVQHCRSSYCPAVDHYALALRIGGEFAEFGEEGVEPPRRRRRDRYIGSDIVIPVSVWKNKSRNELRDYLAKQVRAALENCVARLRRDKETVDDKRLFAEVDAAIREFTDTTFDR
jgi:hypothetical protein